MSPCFNISKTMEASCQLTTIPHIEVNQESQSRPPDSKTSPWLVFLHGHSRRSKKKFQTFFSIRDQKFYVKSIPELNKHRHWPTPQGWLLVEETLSQSWYLLSPMTMEKIKLPPLDWYLSPNSQCLLSAPITHPKCMVVCTHYGEECIYFCHLKDENWTRYDFGEDKIHYTFAYDNNLYVNITPKTIGILDFDPTPRITTLEKHKIDVVDGTRFWDEFSVESGGDMFIIRSVFYVLRPREKFHIDVLKRDSINHSWSIVRDIGDRVFFLGLKKFAASWVASELGIKGNCIYFVVPHEKDLYVFDMETGRISVQQPSPDAHSSWSIPFWIMSST